MKKFLSILSIVILVMGILPVMVTPALAVNGIEAICVPWLSSNPTVPHYTYSGAAHTLKGIARGAATQYYWDFGDGGGTGWAAITNPYNLGVNHVYTGSPGQLFIATLHVTDGVIEDVDTYPVRIFESSDLSNQTHLDVRINMAIDQGLWYLHTVFNRSDYAAGAPGYGQPYGYWDDDRYGYDIAATGAAVDAFQLHGSRVNGDYSNDPYVETVQRALNYLLANAYSFAIGPQPAGNPDTNGNGIGIVINYSGSLTDSRQTYIGGICMVALASSGAPGRIAQVGGANVYLRQYKDIVQDMLDFFAWGQCDPGTGVHRGGWRYYANYGNSDMSTTQWPVLGMMAAEENMGLIVPSWVKDELYLYLDYIQHTELNDYNGAFGYSSVSGDNYLNMTKQGAGIICHEFIGTPLTDSAIQSAIGYIYRHWNDTGTSWYDTRLFFNSYEMYAVMKAMRIPDPDILRITEYDYNAGSQTANSFDWYYKPAGQTQDGIAYRLVQSQFSDGHWNDNVGENLLYTDFSTGWGVLILLKGVATIPPIAQICNAGDLEFDLCDEVPLDGSCSYHPDLTKAIVLYEWDLDGDGQFDDATGVTASIPADTLCAEGYYPIGLRVTDNNPGDPQTSIHTTEIYIHPPCLDPQANAGGPYLGAPNVAVQLDASGTTDPDTAPGLLTYEWDLDNDGLFGTADDDCFGEADDAVGVNPLFTWTSNYVGVIALKVRDVCDLCGGQGQDPCPEWYTGVDIDYTTVTISDNHPPVADAGGPYDGPAGSSVTLDGTGSYDPDGDEITYAWDLDGDGEYDDSTSPTPSYTVPSGGGVVCLRVEDPSGEYDIDCVSVSVSSPQPGPEVGGEIQPMNKLTQLIPLIALGVLLAACGTLILRHRHTQS